MLRAVVVSGTTVVGVGAVLALNPTGQSTTALKVATVRPVAGGGGIVFGPNAPAGGPSSSAPQKPAPSTHPTPSHATTQPVSRASSQPAASLTPSAVPTPSSGHVSPPPSSSAPVAPPPPTSQAPAPTTGPTAATTAPTAPASATAVGQPVDVGYGIVQVQATVSGGKLVTIDPVQLPDASPYSANLNSQAWPLLVQEALQAQSSQIAGVTNATYTSEGFAMSLRSALLALGHSA